MQLGANQHQYDGESELQGLSSATIGAYRVVGEYLQDTIYPFVGSTPRRAARRRGEMGEIDNETTETPLMVVQPSGASSRA